MLSVEVVRIGPGTRREDYEQALEVGSRLQARYVTVNVVPENGGNPGR